MYPQRKQHGDRFMAKRQKRLPVSDWSASSRIFLWFFRWPDAPAPGRPGMGGVLILWAAPDRTFILAMIWLQQKEPPCWPLHQEQSAVREFTTATAITFVSYMKTVTKRCMHTCNICLCIPGRKFPPVTVWGRWGKRETPPGHTFILNCCTRGFAMIRRKHCKQHRSARIYLKAPLVILFILAFALAWDGTGIVRIGLLCALLHEAGHFVMYRWLWHRWPDLQLSPSGICLLLRGVTMTEQQEFLLAAAGPLTNLLSCCSVLAWMRPTWYSYWGYWFASTSLLIGGANLLPFPGLDGERMLHSFWHYR